MLWRQLRTCLRLSISTDRNTNLDTTCSGGHSLSSLKHPDNVRLAYRSTAAADSNQVPSPSMLAPAGSRGAAAPACVNPMSIERRPNHPPPGTKGKGRGASAGRSMEHVLPSWKHYCTPTYGRGFNRPGSALTGVVAAETNSTENIHSVRVVSEAPERKLHCKSSPLARAMNNRTNRGILLCSPARLKQCACLSGSHSN